MAEEKKAPKKSINKSEFYQAVADAHGDLTKADVKKVFAALEAVIAKQLGKRGTGVVTIPGIVKLTARRKPASKGGQQRPNPFKPGEFITTKAKPASIKLVARGVKKFVEGLK